MKKYLQIYHDLLNDIQSNKYQQGDLLPSDQQLVMRYHVSRETIRKAVRLLANEGYLQTIRGKGSLVLNADRLNFPWASIESYRELVKQNGLDSVNDLVQVNYHVPVPSSLLYGAPELTSQLIVRRRIVAGEPLIVDYDYVNEQVAADVPITAARDSLFHYFEETLGLKIDYAIKHITVEPAKYDDCVYLEIDQSTPIVVVRSETHLSDNRILSYTESRHRADKFSSVEFARRHK
ncbi:MULTISPECIES: trehalose operon repressor [Lapidilactobacillus]|uniref:Trehalose operon repressor n=1 Tax=Lapidilactobacillus achengensis TaxID=2486000 RepID=A0ABW1ULB0_9LACO|nr:MULTISPECIES: trehalose operon repressor [Lapidilactobacillus]